MTTIARLQEDNRNLRSSVSEHKQAVVEVKAAVTKGKNIRIYHEFVDRIDNSVPRVTTWHHEALPSDAKQ